ncbi:hypothetical protein F383_28565 [Gossypium arboreum]|uniref:Uncharacterized protein n=1 Tax=Gossypium arboreum TaxID=29729 RepID=A0A0B0PAZ1_GOSAR|nr:hypothetical protein F383_28565 [Gossypium arboreum]
MALASISIASVRLCLGLGIDFMDEPM